MEILKVNQGQKVILIVDDNSNNLKVLSDILSLKGYTIRIATNGKLALKVLSKQEVDLVLLDANMPIMDGYETMKRIKSRDDLQDLPVIFVTALTEVENKIRAFEAGAVDYISKPFVLEEVVARVNTQLNLSQMRHMLTLENIELQKKVMDKVEALTKSYVSTINAMIILAEARDDDTGKHVQRIGEYCAYLAEILAGNGYKEIDDIFIDNIRIASPLHDIGKIAIPDRILLKPGKLEEDEFEIMKTHVSIGGADQLDRLSADGGGSNGYVTMGANIARYHHERWDGGGGYMLGLKGGKDIPLEARIMTIADVYDALRSERPYKKVFSHGKAMTIMETMVGVNFDPYIFEYFNEEQEWFNRKYIAMGGAL